MTTPALTIAPFDPKTASEQYWEWVIDFQISNFKEANPNDPSPPPDLIKQAMAQITNDPERDIKIYLTSVERQFCGAYAMVFTKEDSPEYEKSKHVALGVVWVHPAFRRQGIGEQLLREAVRGAIEKDRTIIELESGTDAGHKFAEKHAGEIALIGSVSRLYTDKTDWQQMENWYNTANKKLPDVTIARFEGLASDNDLAAYCDIYTEVFNQQPFADTEGLESSFSPDKMRRLHKEARELGTRWITMISREADGVISGLTEIEYNAKRPHDISQLLTGVKEDYRGRGLGKFLKAAMMLYIRDEFPAVEYISTRNATVNAPMLKINVDMGFKLHRQLRMYKFDVQTLVEKLA